MHGAHFRGRGSGRGHLLPTPRRHRRRVHPGRAQRGAVALGVRVRHELLLRRHLRGLRRAVRLEVRHRRHVDRHRQRHPGQPFGLVGARPAHARDDAPPGRVHDARVLRRALPVEGFAHRGRGHHLRVPHPVHGERLQRPVAAVRHGVRPAVRGGASSAWRLSPASTWCWAATWPP